MVWPCSLHFDDLKSQCLTAALQPSFLTIWGYDLWQLYFYIKYYTIYKRLFRSSHTVSGHEAEHLAKCLNEELAQQQAAASRSFGNRAVSPDPEPRSRSYECRSPQAKGKGMTNICIRFVVLRVICWGV